jgi:hypothetical protein
MLCPGKGFLISTSRGAWSPAVSAPAIAGSASSHTAVTTTATQRVIIGASRPRKAPGQSARRVSTAPLTIRFEVASCGFDGTSPCFSAMLLPARLDAARFTGRPSETNRCCLVVIERVDCRACSSKHPHTRRPVAKGL